jgi:hypothetical protein
MKLLFNTKININELKTAKEQGLTCVQSRLDCQNNTIICRYGVLPHYQELEQDLIQLNAKLINSYEQHLFVANFEYYQILKKFTPKTWFNIQDINEPGPFIVKGITNSKKMNWNKYMFAVDKKDAMEKMFLLQEDSYLNNQPIIFRKYEKLKTFELGLNELPITNEFRFFYLNGNLIDFGYYWTISDFTGEINQAGMIFANKIAQIIKDKINFVVIDIAQKEDGSWILIELNDGQMSGLATIPADRFYSNLAKLIIS